jgi:DNA primase catalytic core
MDALERIKDIDLRELHRLELGGGNPQQGSCPWPDHPQKQTGKSGAFSYYPDTNSCYCWVCDAGGSTIDYWMLLHGMDFATAVRDLADKYGIELERLTPEQEVKLSGEKRREEALSFALGFYVRQLTEAGPMLDYLTGRGFTLDTIKAARLGFASGQLSAAVLGSTKAIEQRGLSLADFVYLVDEQGRELPNQPNPYSARLIAQDPNGKLRDYLRNRIVFPMFKRGRVVQLSGRDVTGKSERKYLNLKLPQTALYFDDNVGGDRVLVCEGLPDTLTAVQWGFKACGQQGTGGIAKVASRFKRCRRVDVCFDMDGPGRESAVKAAKAIHMEQENGEVRIVALPEGFKDVNEFAQKHGREAFEALLEGARPLLDVLIDGLNPDDAAIKREAETKEVLRLVAHLGPFHHEPYFNRIKARLKVSIGVIKELFKRIVADQEPAPGTPEGEGPELTIDYTESEEIVPAQGFRFGEVIKGNVTTFLPVTRKIEEDGKARTVKRWEPMLITVAHEGHGHKVAIQPCADLALSPSERRRIPTENVVRGRWRAERKFPYSVENFVKGAVADVDAAELYADIVALLRRYIWLPGPIDHEVVAVWIMMTYVYRIFNTVSYLHLHGVRESGKTNLASLIEELAFNAKQSASQSESTLFRNVEGNCCTMLLDESERLTNPDPKSTAYQIMLISNAGYKKGGCVDRSEPDPIIKGNFVPTSFDVFCPKVFASINELYYVLASRCIIIPCLRATAGELEAAGVKDLAQNVHREAPTFADLRDRLHCWALLHFPAIHKAYTDTLIESEGLKHLRGRERELWMPLLTVASHIDEVRCGGDPVRRRELIDSSDSISLRLLSAQFAKEQDRRLTESDQAIEVVALTLLYEAVTGGEISPVRSDWSDGSMFVLSHLSELLTLHLRESGLLGQERTFTAQRLVGLLTKTKAIDGAKDRDRIRVGEKVVRVVMIRPEQLKEVVIRLGGRISATPAAL